ncbi:MAG TPA: hypothetical protein VGM60_12470, partial [Pseudonocardia sp.]
PDPPTAEQAAAIVNEAFRDPAWGMLVWLAMTTGARRGELCALRRDRVDLDNALISIRTSIAQDGAETWERTRRTTNSGVSRSTRPPSPFSGPTWPGVTRAPRNSA